MAKLNYKPANLRGLGTDAQLKPGINNVPDDVWKRWKDHPHIAPLIESGDIQVLAAETEKPRAKPGPKPKAKDEKPGEGDGEGDAKTDAEKAEAAKVAAELEAALKAKAAGK